jgi:hypothetical protein
MRTHHIRQTQHFHCSIYLSIYLACLPSFGSLKSFKSYPNLEVQQPQANTFVHTHRRQEILAQQWYSPQCKQLLHRLTLYSRDFAWALLWQSTTRQTFSFLVASEPATYTNSTTNALYKSPKPRNFIAHNSHDYPPAASCNTTLIQNIHLVH